MKEGIKCGEVIDALWAVKYSFSIAFQLHQHAPKLRVL
jgi:hypothetical protein